MTEQVETNTNETNATEAAAAPAAKSKAKKEAKPKIDKVIQNGVTRPGSGTSTGKVWDIADDLSRKSGGPAKRADVMKVAEEAGINAATVATQYGKWRKFHGIVAEKTVKPEEAPKAAE